mmetsp:Transcript_45677/g.108772  ORF Transcript_45677/g.108772 Transcript_45677/m.108772 type:complete len:319 (-) Transcript_45677:99-1055(-)
MGRPQGACSTQSQLPKSRRPASARARCYTRRSDHTEVREPEEPQFLPHVLARPAGREDLRVIQCLHHLVAKEAAALPARPSAMALRSKDDKRHAEAFAESCLMSLAVWRRFGTAEFAEAFGWVHRTDYAATLSLVQAAVDAAVTVWKHGFHAAARHTLAQRNTQSVELQAWGVNCAPECIVEVPPAAEASVRRAYERLLTAIHHPIIDLWRKREAIVDTALRTQATESIRAALMQVRGYCPPDADADRAGWELAVDLRTLTPLAVDPGPVEWNTDYVLWRRKRHLSDLSAPITRPLLRSQHARRRPSVAAKVDLTGFA